MPKCISPDCRAGGDRTSLLSPLQIEEVGEPWADRAERCSYCGGVSGMGSDGRRLHRGYLNAPMMPQGWLPSE